MHDTKQFYNLCIFLLHHPLNKSQGVCVILHRRFHFLIFSQSGDEDESKYDIS